MGRKANYCLVLEPAPGRPWGSLHRCKFSLTARLQQDGLIDRVFLSRWSDHQLGSLEPVDWEGHRKYMLELSEQYPDIRFCLYISTGKSHRVEYFVGGLYAEVSRTVCGVYPTFDAASLHIIG